MYISDNRRGRKRSKSRTCNGENTSSDRCYHWKKNVHTIRLCLERQKKANNLDKSSRFGRQSSADKPSTLGEVALIEDSYESSEVLMCQAMLMITSG